MSETLLPPNATSLELAVADAVARNIEVPIADLWDPDACPEHLLPWLAHAMSVDEWEASWPLERRRQIIRDTVQIHRRKGTVISVSDAIRSFGYGDHTIVEGMNADLHDGTRVRDGSRTYGQVAHWAEYRVFLSRIISIGQADRLVEILSKVAPVRCHLMAINYERAANIYDGTLQRDGSYTRGVV